MDEGVPGMKVGGKRRLRIPSGPRVRRERQPSEHPGGAGLVFEIELVSNRVSRTLFA